MEKLEEYIDHAAKKAADMASKLPLDRFLGINRALGEIASIRVKFAETAKKYRAAKDEFDGLKEKYDAYRTVMTPFIEGDENARVEALATRTCVSIYGHNETISEAAHHMQSYDRQVQDALGKIDKLYGELFGYQAAVMKNAGDVSAAYAKYEEAKAAAEAQEKLAASNNRKTIRWAIDVSWPMSPREIQRAIDTLSAVNAVTEDGIDLAGGIEGLKALKKSAEDEIAKKATVEDTGHLFVVKVAE